MQDELYVQRFKVIYIYI